MPRLMTPLTRDDLRNLKRLGLKEHLEFFERNPHLRNAYHDSLIGICLCQGAASHYLNPRVGINDFDIWHFYLENSNVNFPYRSHKIVENGYNGRSLDFLKRAIPRRISDFCSNHPGQTIMNYLLEKNTRTKRLLLKKAVVGLYPNIVFDRILWKGDL